MNTTTADASATSATITGLTNGTAHRFTVTATNALGEGPASNRSAAITPRTTPGAPVLGTATAGNGSTVVRWTAPAETGGAAITRYTVRTYQGTTLVKSTTAAATATSVTIRGLANGTSYTFTVTAANQVGWSSPSASSGTVQPKA
jgi:predicted phage tail protein